MSEVIKVHKPLGGLRLTVKWGEEAIHHFPPPGGQPARREKGTVEEKRPESEPVPRFEEVPAESIDADAEFKRGFEAGRVSALSAMREEMEKDLYQKTGVLEALIAGIGGELAALYQRLEREAFHFAVAVAGKIIKREVVLDNETVIRQIKDAVHRIVGVETIKVRVHPLDEPVVREHRSAVASSADSIRELIIEGDDKVERGGCIIESASGNIDARRSTQLRQIESALFSDVKTTDGGRP